MDTVIPPSASPVIAHRGWRATRAHLLEALRAGPGLTALLGAPGVGKSMLLHEIARTLLADAVDVTILRRGDAARDFELHGVILIDEADRMAPGALAALAARDDVAVVLAALPGFADRLPDLPGIGTVRLTPLGLTDAAEFIAVRLAQGGHPADLLTPAATAELLRQSGGIPRVLHTLLGFAILAASLENAPRVTSVHVVQAASFHDGEGVRQPPGPVARTATIIPEAAPAVTRPLASHRRRWGGWAIAAAVALCLGGIATLLPFGASTPQRFGALASATATPPASQASADLPVAPAAEPVVASVDASLPSGSLIRVVLSYPAGNTDAARRGADLVRHLRADGVTISEPVPMSLSAPASALLYYFTQDRDGAAAVSSKLDGQFGEPMLARLSPRSPLPRPGTIELVLAAAGP